MALVKYDKMIIVVFAQRLYEQADSVVAKTAVMGVIFGAAIGGGASAFNNLRGDGGALAGIGAVIGGVAGFMRGREAAFKLRLQAQVALCQVQIEANCRPAVPVVEAHAPRP